MKYYTTLEDSKRLQEAGISGSCESEWLEYKGETWAQSKDITRLLNINDRVNVVAPAYILGELLGMVEGDLKSLDYGKEKWSFDCRNSKYEARIFFDEDPKHAVVEALLWQKGA